MKLRNPLIARNGPPVALNVRAARWGAVATVIGLGILLWPVIGGYRQAQTILALDPAACGKELIIEPWSEGTDRLQQEIVSYFLVRCQPEASQ
ncbi:MAG: hypothetical protein AAF919_18245 [Pseudomonadota bacterium]